MLDFADWKTRHSDDYLINWGRGGGRGRGVARINALVPRQARVRVHCATREFIANSYF